MCGYRPELDPETKRPTDKAIIEEFTQDPELIDAAENWAALQLVGSDRQVSEARLTLLSRLEYLLERAKKRMYQEMINEGDYERD